MEYDKEDNGFISVPAPEFGAIFMSNIATKRDCFKHKVFGLPSSMANFVKEVKTGMVLFLFGYERRQLFGVYRAISDGEMNIVPHAFRSSGKQFSAQVRFMPIWNCRPLSENEFRDAIFENYFSARKFHFGLSDEQVRRLLRLFSSRKINNKLPSIMLTTGVSSRDDEDHILVNTNIYRASGGFDHKPSKDYLKPSLSRGYPRSFRGVRRGNSGMFLNEHRVEDEDKVDSAEHVCCRDKKRRIGYDGKLLRDNAAEDKLQFHSLMEELGFSGDDWPSLNNRVKNEHKIDMNHTPFVSNFMGDSDLRRTADDENLVARDHMVNENNMDSGFDLGRSTENHGKPSDSGGARLGTHYARFSRNNSVDKAHKLDNSHEPALSRENRTDAFWNIRTVNDDWQTSLEDRVGNKGHLDPDINSTIVSECFVDPSCNLKRNSKDGKLFAKETRGIESQLLTGPGREFDHQAATNDALRFPSRHEGANEKYVDGFLIPATSNGNSTYAGDIGAKVAKVGGFQMNDFNGLVPGTENFQSPLTLAERTSYSPMKKRTSGYSTKFFDKTKSPPSTEAQNLGPSFSKLHDATITRVMPYKHEPSSSCWGHNSTTEVERGSNSVWKLSSSNVLRENNFAPSKGISPPYAYPEFAMKALESPSEDGEKVLLRSQDGFRSPLNIGISEAMGPNRFSSGYTRPSITEQFTRDEINKGEKRFSSKAALGSIANHLFSGNYQCADEELGNEHVIWQESDGTHIGRRSCSPNTSWLPHQGNVLTNLDHDSSLGTDFNDECEGNLHSDSRNSRRSVFSRLSLIPKVGQLREQNADHNMSYDEYYMDTTVDEIMGMLYKDQNVVPKKLLNRKPIVRKVRYGETNKSGKHAAVAKNDGEQPGDSVMREMGKSENEVLEETVNHVLAETRVVDFKRRRETNQASEEANDKLNKEEMENVNGRAVLHNAQENSFETASAKGSDDKAFKRRKLVRPAFDENCSRSDLNHQLPFKEVGKVSTENLDYIPL